MTSLTVAGPTPLRGRMRVPGDKSISHRALLLAALADGTSTVRGLAAGDDVARTRAAVTALGATVEGDHVSGGELHEPQDVIDLGNSGTAIRLLAGLCAGQPFLTVLTGDASVRRRPMDRVVDPLRRMGAAVDGREGGRRPPLAVRGGGLAGIDYQLLVASAQVKGAVLLAGLAADGETTITETAVTRAHTEEMLAACGADLEVQGRTVRLRPSPLKPFTLDVPGDPSAAAFWVVGACIVPGGDLTVEGVYLGPARTGFLDVLRRMGADLEVDEPTGTIRARASTLRGTVVEPEEIPALVDEVPALAVAAAAAEGTTRFLGAGELRLKESDRLATVASELAVLGARVEATSDGLIVTGGSRLRGATVRSHGDHRVAMAMAVAGLAAEGETVVDGWDAVATSYPEFEKDLRSCTS